MDHQRAAQTAAMIVPARIAALPVDPQRGVPVPWFVVWLDDAGQQVRSGEGKPEFRVVDPEKFVRAIKEKLCWVCGQTRGRWSAFVLGPMCGVTRTTSEPPCHEECAVFSACACPFLTRPRMHRRTAGMPEQLAPERGLPILRNPGVALVWETDSWKVFGDQNGAPMISVGPPAKTLWFAEGRTATRAEVEESIRTGLPILEEQAALDGTEAVADLARLCKAFEPLLPRAEASPP